MNNLLSSLTSTQLRRAADLKEQIEALNKQMTSLLGTSSSAPASAPKKFKMSASAKAKIAAAQKARWAKVNAAKPATSKKPAQKRAMSAAAKAKISAAAKARWAKIKASK